MKWLKLDTDNLSDEKIEELLAAHGPVGYGIYIACVSLIAGRLSEDNPTVELKHTAAMIAHKLYTTEEEVRAVMETCLRVKLFIKPNGYMECPALWKRVDDNTRKSLRSKSGVTPESVRLEEKRIEEKRKEEVAPAVHLTTYEQQRLVAKYGADNTAAAFTKLSAYKLQSGRKYASDYGAILHWVMDDVVKKAKASGRDNSIAWTCGGCGKQHRSTAATCECGWERPA